jgi:hypothetical protein
MSDLKKAMVLELQRFVIPKLRQSGFAGAFPHLRRIQPEWIDLLTFQFDRYGGGLVVEIGRCKTSGIVTHWGEQIPPRLVRAWDLNRRKRIQARPGSGRFDWFRFDEQSPVEAAKQIGEALSSPNLWEMYP